MKKIVMAVAAVAMAASMFAADVSAQLVMNTNLFDSAKKTVLSAPETAYDINNTHVKFAVSGDKAGASYILQAADTKFDVISLWFQPVDALKITLGAADTGSLTRGTFAWWHRTVRTPDGCADAITVNANVGGLALEFVNFGGSLLNFSKDGYDMVGKFILSGTYGLGDAGTIQVIATKGANVGAYGIGGWKAAGNLAIGVAYDHMPWQQTGFFADAVANLDGAWKFEGVYSQIGGQYCADGLALRLVNLIAYNTAFKYGFVTECSYAMDSMTPYVKVMGNGIMDKAAEVNAGIRANVGICAIDASFHTNIKSGADFACDFPVSCKVSF